MPKETRKKSRKRKGGKQDLCKLYNKALFPKRVGPSRVQDRGGGPGEDTRVTQEEADKYCSEYYLADGTLADGEDAGEAAIGPANKCTPAGCRNIKEGQVINLVKIGNKIEVTYNYLIIK